MEELRRFVRFVRSIYRGRVAAGAAKVGVYNQPHSNAETLRSRRAAVLSHNKPGLQRSVGTTQKGRCIPHRHVAMETACQPSASNIAYMLLLHLSSVCVRGLRFTDCGPALPVKHDSTESEHRTQIAVGTGLELADS